MWRDNHGEERSKNVPISSNCATIDGPTTVIRVGIYNTKKDLGSVFSDDYKSKTCDVDTMVAYFAKLVTYTAIAL